jgi:hypothetical protein
LAYVHVLTLMAAAMCAWFLFAAWTQSFLWAIPAAFAIPTTILFYARHWGRFAWLALNFVPHSKAPAAAKKPASDTDTVPEMDVLEIEEGIRSGPPPAGDGIKASSGAGAKTMAAPTPYHAEDDEATMETKPYLMVEDPTKPNFQDAEDAPLAPAAAQSTSAAPVEEEDEWATEKKPYGLIGDADFKAPPTDAADARKPEADRPIVVGKHFDEQHAREKEKKRQAQVRDDVLDLPVPSKKTPTFADALFFGVWRFMIYERTLSVWLNLIVLTAAELFFLYMVRQFLPQV